MVRNLLEVAGEDAWVGGHVKVEEDGSLTQNMDIELDDVNSLPVSPGSAAVSGKPWVPCWWHAGDAAPIDGIAGQVWEDRARRDPAASVYFLPSIALGAYQNEGVPLVYARWMDAAGTPQLNSLAVLPPRKFKVPIIPWFRWAVNLPGRRVLENGLLGDRGPESLECFVSSIVRILERGDADCIIFTDLDANDPLREAMVKASQKFRVAVTYPSNPAPHWWIRFPDKPDEYWSQFSKKTRYNFRYRAKHLEHSVRCVREPDEVPGFLERAEELARRTWQRRRLGAIVSTQKRLELWRAVAREGGFRSYLLLQGDQTLAFATCFQWKGRFVYEETGYDPDFAASSPGQVLLYRIIEDLIASDTPKLFDFGYGDGESKRMFANHQTLSGPVVLVRKTLLPMTLVRMTQCRSLLGRAARAALAKAGVLPVLRHLHRGHG